MEPRRLSPAPFDGRSRGAVAVNHRPKLFGSVVYVNAFLDITTSMANPTLALTEHEWGDPRRDKVAAEAIRFFCFMTNIQPNTLYPPTLLILPWMAFFGISCQDTRKRRARTKFFYVAEQGGRHLHGTSLDMF
jgi:hypothetical protein